MKNFSLLLIVLAFQGVIYAQDIKVEQVHFKKGTSGATIEASIQGYEIIDYRLNVQKGQTINVSMATDNTATYFNLMEPKEKEVAIFNGSMGENMYEGELMKSGDYTIRVYMMRSAARRNEKANFRLEINVSALKDKASTEDALVSGTNFNATGKIPCSFGDDGSFNCDFGVVRKNTGNAILSIKTKDGQERKIYFEDGKATKFYDGINETKDIKVSKESDVYIITIGKERYEIPEAVVYGG